MQYIVTVKEIWKYRIKLNANSPDEARDIVEKKIHTVDEDIIKYSHTLEKSQWEVEEINKVGIKKITTGYVIQEFDEAGNCTKQEFIEGKPTIEEVNSSRFSFDKIWNKMKTSYFPYDMIQP